MRSDRNSKFFSFLSRSKCLLYIVATWQVYKCQNWKMCWSKVTLKHLETPKCKIIFNKTFDFDPFQSTRIRFLKAPRNPTWGTWNQEPAKSPAEGHLALALAWHFRKLVARDCQLPKKKKRWKWFIFLKKTAGFHLILAFWDMPKRCASHPLRA